LEKIEVSSLLKTNGVFHFLTGLPTFPDPQTLRRFLLRSSTELLPSLWKVHNDLKEYFILQPSSRPSFCLDFDSTAKTLYGNQEGVVKGYNPGHPGRKSYHPLVVSESSLKDCLGGFLRFGNAYTSDGVTDLFHQARSLLPSSIRLRTRADSGFYEGSFIQTLDENFVKFAIVAKVSKPLKKLFFNADYQRINDKFSTSEFLYQPGKWKKAYRYVVLRRKIEEQDDGLTLFTVDNYAYSVIVTNLSMTPYGVFTFYKDRAGLERIIRILKNDFPFAAAPTANFCANALYAEISLLAYNLVMWFKRLCLPDDWKSFTLETLRHKLLLMPGELVHTDNIHTLKFPRNSPNKNVFEFALNKIKKLKSLV
ncbi:MAG: IS1380 family transposase, partial [Deltaproteobacteria bacterium]